jgi:hypothetical protein
MKELIFIIIFIVSLQTFGQSIEDDSINSPCYFAGTQTELNICTYIEYQRLDDFIGHLSQGLDEINCK